MSNKKKLNSIDWLVEELRKYIEEPWKYVPKGGKEAIIKQAKAMHKEEIIDFAMKFMMQDRPIISFYNETFGGNNEQQ